MGDEEGRRKKQREAKEPSAANPKSNGLRNEAGFTGIETGEETSKQGPKAHLYLRFHPWKLLSRLVMRLTGSMCKGYIRVSDLSLLG